MKVKPATKGKRKGARPAADANAPPQGKRRRGRPRKRPAPAEASPVAEKATPTAPGIFGDELDTSTLDKMLCPWHTLDMRALRRAFAADSPMVALYEGDAAAARWLGLTYDPHSPFVRTYRDVRERKEAAFTFVGIADERRRKALALLTDKGVVAALIALLARIHHTKWALLVAEQEVVYRTIALSTYLPPRLLDTESDKLAKKTLLDMKSLTEAGELTDRIEAQLLEITAGDNVAAKRVENSPDFGAEFVAGVLNVFIDGNEDFDSLDATEEEE